MHVVGINNDMKFSFDERKAKRKSPNLGNYGGSIKTMYPGCIGRRSIDYRGQTSLSSAKTKHFVLSHNIDTTS
jgi:hypothetical protein